MGTPISDALEQASEEALDKAVAKISERLTKALQDTKVEVVNKLQEVIDEDMVDYYYEGYTPVRYRPRTKQLGNSVEPILHDFTTSTKRGFQFGIAWHPENMHHIKPKPKSENAKKPYPVDETKIDECFSRGIHPNGVERGGTVNQGPIWIMGDSSNTGTAANIIRKWAKEEINNVMQNAMHNAMK